MAHKALVLVVDDDPAVQALLQDLLAAAGYAVRTAASAFQARGTLLKQRPDIVLLDRNLPDTEGIDLLREIRSQPALETLPVLFLTAMGTPADKTEGLRRGGDDYLAKPFSNNELLARVESLLRRSRRPPEPAHFLEAGGIRVDLDRHRVEAGGRAVELSPKEYALLVAFLEGRGRVLSRSFLLERVWGSGMGLRMNSKTVDVAVGRLRRALGPTGQRIVAVQSFGYRLDGAA